MKKPLTNFFSENTNNGNATALLLLLCCIFFMAGATGCLKGELPFKKQAVKGPYNTWRFALSTDTAKINKLPDFSFAGYKKNEEPIPLVPVKAIVEPESGDDGARIQQAIDKVSRLPLVNGFRGAVLLKAGTYQVDSALYIRASGVVLRGEGQGVKGTILIATYRGPHEMFSGFRLINVNGDGSGHIKTGKALSPIAASFIPIGATKIQVESTTDFSVGDSIVIMKTPNNNWLTTIGMAQYGWTTNQFEFAHRRVVRAISGDTLIIAIPMVDAIEQQFGGGYVTTVSFPGRISHCGVENMRLRSVYANDTDMDHAWTGVRFSRVTNSWVRNVTALHFTLSCVNIVNESDFNTIQDCAMLDPIAGRTFAVKYSFRLYGGMGNLFQRCYARNGMYDFLLGSKVTGPNVFLDCYSDNYYGNSGPHFWWITGSLFDNVYAGVLQARNDKDMGTYHGWTGAQTMFWNCKAIQGFGVESPPGAINWVVGGQSPWRLLSNAFYISWRRRVQPRSLFLAQLEKRLGTAVVNEITIPAQRGTHNIWSMLTKWDGGGQPLKGFQ